MDRLDILDLEAKGCFDFFWNEATTEGEGFGLIRDNTTNSERHKKVASVASVGFGLSAIIVGVERGWITKEEGEKRALGTLKTLYNDVEQTEGFFNHFVNMNSGKREWNSEASIIDTAIAIMGALTCAEYFKGEVEEYFERIYSRINWEFYRNPKTNHFYMGYSKEQGPFGAWDMTAEQFMMYFLGVASPTHPVPASMFYDFRRDIGSYGGDEFIYTPIGSIFPYQFSHAWIDFRNTKDKLGVDWFENSVKASLSNRQYCIDNPVNSKSFHKNAWGMTACETHHGYDGSQGTLPSAKGGTVHTADGTVPPCGAIGSIVFTPEESIDAMNYYYKTFKDKLWGKYGFKDAYNLDVTPEWFSKVEIGIDKGISILMIENYRSGLIWNLTMQNKYIKKAMELLEITNNNVEANISEKSIEESVVETI